MLNLPFNTLTPSLIQGKTVLLRLDLDVPIENGKVVDDFRLLAGMETLGFCLDHANSVVIMGHIGRPARPAGGPEGEDPDLTVKPIVRWLEEGYGHIPLPVGKLHILENLRFERGEEDCDPAFVKELASFGDVFVNEAFASHHKASSTTEIAKLLPPAAGFNFQKEVEVLTQIREKPDRPLIAIIGGAKIEDKMPAVMELSRRADMVLVGGKLVSEILRGGPVSEQPHSTSSHLLQVHAAGGQWGTPLAATPVVKSLPSNVFLAELTPDGEDISENTVQAWEPIIKGAKMVLWNGPLGRVEEEKNDKSRKIAQIIIESGAKSVLGGGDTIAYLDKLGLLKKFWHVSTGGGAMLKFLAEGTLPTIEALSS